MGPTAAVKMSAPQALTGSSSSSGEQQIARANGFLEVVERKDREQIQTMAKEVAADYVVDPTRPRTLREKLAAMLALIVTVQQPRTPP